MHYGSFSKHFEHTYYGNGLKRTFTAPDTTEYTYAYGTNNQLQSVQIPGVGTIEIPAYSWNRPAAINYPGGVSRTATYDALMRPNTVTVTDPGGLALLTAGYEYDAAGNIRLIQREAGMTAYDYDPASRLTSADHPALDDENYTYDHVGNRTTASNAAGSIAHNLNNELLRYSDIAYDYDANGNMTRKSVGAAAVNFLYNAENRLVKVEDDLTKVVMAEYGYDPFGRRLWKEVNGTRTYFFYSEEGLIAEYDASGNELRSYGYKPDSTWTTDPLWLKQNGTYYWYLNDHLGTPQKLVDSSGAVVWSAQYTAFGEAVIAMETVENNLRFPGQYYDAETGLHYNRFRYYDPFTGRYPQPDLIESTHAYLYVDNNPLLWADPIALAKILIDLGHGDIAWYYKTTSERDPTTNRTTVLDTTTTRKFPDAGGTYPHPIDISHCGTPGNFCEKDLVMSIGPELKKRLERLGHDVILSRNGDWGNYEDIKQKEQNKDPSGQSIEWRILLANQETADYIVSVHVNKKTEQHNFQVYYYSGRPDAAVFAKHIQVSVEKENLFEVCELKPTGEGVEATEYPDVQPGDLDYIPETIRIIWKSYLRNPNLTASVLLEVGDIGTQQTRDFWTNEKLIDAFINSLVQGIQDGIEVTEE